MVVNVHETKLHFPRLVKRAVRGEEVVIGQAGKPVAKLVPYREDDTPRVPGGWRGADPDRFGPRRATRRAGHRLSRRASMRLLLDTHFFLLWWLVDYSSLGKEARAGVLPRHHDNPFDRMLVAHAGSACW
jgi:prevent-host-death family protein